jgi:outer membrane protein assembly factor BamB
MAIAGLNKIPLTRFPGLQNGQGSVFNDLIASHMKNKNATRFLQQAPSPRRISVWALAAAASAALLCPPLGFAASAPEANWPHWRGPLDTGVAPKGNPPAKWSETENVQWKVKLPGSGTATPIIWDNQVFIQTAIPNGKKPDAAKIKAERLASIQVMGAPAPGDAPPAGQPGRRRPGGPGGGGGMRSEKPSEPYQFVLMSLDRDTGKVLWQKVAREEVPHEGHHPDHGFSSHSPVTDGQNIYSYFGSRGLHCYDMQGNLKWEKDLGRMQTRNSFGEGSSPALFGKTIVVNWDHEGDDFIVAFNKDTGKELWRQPRSEDTTWATPLIVQHDGKAQVVTSATRKIRSYDLETGKLIWECGGMTANVIPSPVAGNDMVYPISGFRGNALLAIKLGRTGDLTDSDAIAWKRTKNTPYVPSPLLYGDRLYFFSNNSGILSCDDAKNGKTYFDAERVEALQGVYASPVGAGDKIYLLGRTGTSVVIKKSDQLEVIATNKLDEKFDASPAIAGKQLFLRGHQYLYSIAEK